MLKLRIDTKLIFKLVILIFLAFTISGCATTSANISDINAKTKFSRDQIQNELLKLDSSKVTGVIGIIYNNQAESANYIYSQDGDKFNIKLYGPFGVGSVDIKGDSNKVSLENSKGQKVQANDIKSLMLEQLGWYVPVEGLKFWIKGIAVPNIAKEIKLTNNNLIDTMKQNGWSISYKDYKLINNKYPLPSKIRISRDNLTLKIVIKSWQL